MATRVVFRDKGVVGFESFEPEADLPSGSARVQAAVSLISTGTEGICLHRLFDPGTHWDQWVKYPHYPGYSMIGTVAELGPEVTGLEVGTRVAGRLNHKSETIAKASALVPVPDGVTDVEASWFALAKIGHQGFRASEQRLGDDVLVVGAGPIGQMALRWALAAGARRAVTLDPVPFRLDLADRGGATATICGTVDEAEDGVRQAFDGGLPNIVIDTTGHAAVFAGCLPLTADYGRVVILGDTGRPNEQRLTLDVIRRGLHIVGAHDMHEDARWNGGSVTRLFFDLVRRGRFPLDGLSTHAFAPSQAPEAYDLLTTKRNETMGVRFDWSLDR
jgi:threonine dehydrogenase-like Zn-dependent dehydrogenase